MSYRKTATIEPRFTKAMSLNLSSERNDKRLPSVYEGRRKKPPKNKDNFDKYYIHPTLRYKMKN